MLDRDAYELGKQTAPELTEAELQFALALSRHETSFGDGWPEGAGKGSNNMGAITEPDVARPHFDHLDHHRDGTPFVSHFKAYGSKQEGFRDVVREALKPNVRAALARGDADGAVDELGRNGYFEAQPAAYIAAMKRNHAALVRGAGIQSALTFGRGGLGALLLLAALVWGFSG